MKDDDRSAVHTKSVLQHEVGPVPRCGKQNAWNHSSLRKHFSFFFISALLALSAIVLQFCPHQSLNSSLPYFLSIYIISCFKYVPSSYCHELSVQASLIPYVKNLRQSWRLLYVTRSDQLYGVSNKIKIYKPTETHNYWNYWVARAVHSCQDARVT